jgi:hypothetical protein
MLKRFIVFVLVLVFVSPTLAKSHSVRSFLDLAVKKNIISGYSVIPLPKALPANSREAKYSVLMRIKGKSKVIPFTVFFATPKRSTRFVFKIGITFQGVNPFDDDSGYAIGFLSGFFATACLNFSSSQAFDAFSSEVNTTIQSEGSGFFNQTFGALQVSAAGTYAFNQGTFMIAFIRPDRPRGAWKNYCTL